MADEAVVATFEGQPLRAEFPLHVVMFGIACVCIPEARYRYLAAAGPRRATSPGGARQRKARLSRLDKDPEVRAFILTRLGNTDLTVIRAETLKQFGADRTPSRSALNRFALTLRSNR